MVYFRSDKNQIKPKVWDIKKTQTQLTREICQILPYIHALTSCDSTSRIKGIGKPSVLEAVRKNEELREIGNQMMKPDQSPEEVIKLSERALVQVMGGPAGCNVSLDTLRFLKFASKVMTRTVCVQVDTLPPTSTAARYHNQRTYFQTQVWIGNNTLDPLGWGWDMTSKGTLKPIRTSLAAAPEQLLKVVRCNCKANCDTKRCSCRKHGLNCTVGCGSCRGICTNSIKITDNDIENDID